MQGTLDFACAIYAVINALAVTHGINLATSRRIFADTVDALSNHRELKRAFLYNETDHYWVIRYCLARYCQAGPLCLGMLQPFGSGLMPSVANSGFNLEQAELFVEDDEHSSGRLANRPEVWKALEEWLSPEVLLKHKRAAIMRFHRFMPGVAEPVVSHWTTCSQVGGDVLYLHDASSEMNAIHQIRREDLQEEPGVATPLYIVPSSVIFLQKHA